MSESVCFQRPKSPMGTQKVMTWKPDGLHFLKHLGFDRVCKVGAFLWSHENAAQHHMPFVGHGGVIWNLIAFVLTLSTRRYYLWYLLACCRGLRACSAPGGICGKLSHWRGMEWYCHDCLIHTAKWLSDLKFSYASPEGPAVHRVLCGKSKGYSLHEGCRTQSSKTWLHVLQWRWLQLLQHLNWWRFCVFDLQFESIRVLRMHVC